METGRFVSEAGSRLIRELSDFCRIGSVSARGEHLEEASKFLKNAFEARGFEVKLLETQGPPAVFAELRGRSNKTLMFYNHYDVQPPEPLEEWVSDPFQPEIRDGRLYARGVCDNKGNLMARIHAVEAYLATEGSLPCSVKFFVEGEEEVGSPHMDECISKYRHLLSADSGIWESGQKDSSGRFCIYLGVKGLCYVELEALGAEKDAHSSTATVTVNPGWRLVWALSRLKDERERILIPGFYDDVVPLTAEDEEFLDSMPNLSEEVDEPSDALLKGFSQRELVRRHFFEPTCNICGLISGYTGPGSKTVLPSKALAKVDFRLVCWQDPNDVQRKLESYLKSLGFSDIRVRGLGHERPARTPSDAAIVKIVKDACKAISGLDPVVYPTMAASGPMPFFVEDLNIPMVCVGIGGRGSSIHAPNENIVLADYFQNVELMARIIKDFSEAVI